MGVGGVYSVPGFGIVPGTGIAPRWLPLPGSAPAQIARTPSFL